MGKYNKVKSLNQFEALSIEMVPKIVEHIEKGLSLAPMFENILSHKSRKLTALERLGSYWDKTNEEFDELFDSLVKELKDGSISEPVDIGKSIKPDHDVLVKLRALVEEEAKSKVSIEKWSYDRLIEG